MNEEYERTFCPLCGGDFYQFRCSECSLPVEYWEAIHNLKGKSSETEPSKN